MKKRYNIDLTIILYKGLSYIPARNIKERLSDISKTEKSFKLSHHQNDYKWGYYIPVISLSTYITYPKYFYKIYGVYDNDNSREKRLMQRKINRIQDKVGMENYKPTLKHRYYLTHYTKKGLRKMIDLKMHRPLYQFEESRHERKYNKYTEKQEKDKLKKAQKNYLRGRIL